MDNVFLQSRIIDALQNRIHDGLEMHLKQLDGTEGDVFPCSWNQLPEHVQHPDDPEDMENRQLFKEIEAVKNIQHFRPVTPDQDTGNKNQDPDNQFDEIKPPDSGHMRF